MRTALFIGRFQPFHKGHLQVIKDILKDNDKLIIAIGSAQKFNTAENPLTAEERSELIILALQEAEIPKEKYQIIPVTDIDNYPLWVDHINLLVPHYDAVYTGSEIVTECFKNHRSKVEINSLPRFLDISAAKIRYNIVNNTEWESYVPKVVAQTLKKWKIDQKLKTLK